MFFYLDVDGVVADFVGTLLKDINHISPHNLSNLDIKHFKMLDKEHSVLTQIQIDYAKELLNTPGYGQTFSLIENAQKSYAKIQARGHQIRWLTSSWSSNPTWEYDRRIWLKNHFDTHKHDICFYHKKWELGGDVFIDDKPENVWLWQEQNPSGLGCLFYQPWNADATGCIRFSWNEIDAFLDKLE